MVGGKGTRLRSVVADRPKPMAEIFGRPFLEWMLLALKLQGIKRVVLSVGHMAEYIQSFFGEGESLGIELVYALDPFPLGTGGALRNALRYLKTNTFVALNGDSYSSFNLNEMDVFHRQHNASCTICLTHVVDKNRYGSIELDSSDAVTLFQEKNSLDQSPGLINAGIYIFERSFIEKIPAGIEISLEKDFFPEMIGRGLFAYKQEEGIFIDIGTPASYEAAGSILSGEFLRLDGLR